MTDFLVVGAGIAGISAAARLSELGSVVILEAEDAIGCHASGRSAAMYLASYGNTAIQALNRASLPELTDLDVLSPRGVLTLATSTQSASLDRAISEGAEEIGFESAKGLCPILNAETCDRIALTKAAMDLDTDKLLQHFARLARKNGAEILTGARVQCIERRPGGWCVEATGCDPLHARYIVNAAGAWADVVAALAGVAPMGLVPLRRSAARMPPPGDADVRGWPMLLGADEDWYAKPDAGAWIVSPSEEDPVPPQDAWADDMVLAEGIARYEAMVTEPVTRVSGSWAGLRTFAPDRALVLGPDPEHEQFLWCAGQGGYGFQTACAASRFLAEGVGGPSVGLDQNAAEALRPERLRQCIPSG
ncbi:MAG: FAD-dependent oxidoreductase [Pseudomonadota bacterium]